MNHKREQLANEILQYLVDHPNAQDTLRHVVIWWFVGQKTKPRTALVKAVLEKLVDESKVIEERGSDSQVRYKLNIEKRQEIISELKRKS